MTDSSSPRPGPCDLAWAAGLFEGEGHASYTPARHRRIMSLSMTDEDIVRRFAAIVGRGRVRPYTPKDHRKPFWSWSVSSHDDCLYVGGLLFARLGPRRRAQIQTIYDHPPRLLWTPERRAADPEGYAQVVAERRRRWRENGGNAKSRAWYHANAERLRAEARERYRQRKAR